MDSKYFGISTAKCYFSVNLRYKIENLNKIWKFKNPRWRPPVTSFIWLLLPRKPIRHHVVSLNWKYKWSLLYVPNFKSIGWIVSKVEGGRVRLTPLPSRLRVTIFSSRLLGLINNSSHLWSIDTGLESSQSHALPRRGVKTIVQHLIHFSFWFCLRQWRGTMFEFIFQHCPAWICIKYKIEVSFNYPMHKSVARSYLNQSNVPLRSEN